MPWTGWLGSGRRRAPVAMDDVGVGGDGGHDGADDDAE